MLMLLGPFSPSKNINATSGKTLLPTDGTLLSSDKSTTSVDRPMSRGSVNFTESEDQAGGDICVTLTGKMINKEEDDNETTSWDNSRCLWMFLL